MRLAVIPPTANAQQLSRVEGGTVHLCLSHLVMNDPGYAQFYKELPDEDYVILDNSAHEIATGHGWEILARCIDKIEPDEVVLPDRLFFGEDTYDRSEKACEALRGLYGGGLKFMAVPQGRTWDEWMQCLTKLSDLPLSTIGISKDYEVWPGGLLSLVAATPDVFDIHLLGWSRRLVEPMKVEKMLPGRVRSIDTAKPVVYALHSQVLERDILRGVTPPKYPTRDFDFFNVKLTDDQMIVALHNIALLREGIGDPSETWVTI